jgi:monothiol glutaredoxin
MQLGTNELNPSNLTAEQKARFDEIVSKDKIVLFMKGNKNFPQCGFSDAVVKALKFYNADFVTYDVLTDPEIRSGMKHYSEWATFPQLYVNKEFVGGCDIVMSMHESGELEAALKA